MRRESHVRFWEGGGVRFPSATRLFIHLFHVRTDAGFMVLGRFSQETRGPICTYDGHLLDIVGSKLNPVVPSRRPRLSPRTRVPARNAD